MAAFFQVIHTPSSAVSWVHGLLSGWFDFISSGKIPSLGFPSLFCSATLKQVPGIAVNCVEQYYSLACFGSQERRKVIDIYDLSIAGHEI